jgi:hypothetical protein
LFGAASGSEGPALAVLAVASHRADDDSLLDQGSDVAGLRTYRRFVDGYRAPCEQLEALGLAGGLDGVSPRARIVGIEKDHRHAGPGRVVAGHGLGEDRMGEREQDPGPVAGQGVGRHRAAMLDPTQGVEGGIDDRPGGPPSGIRDEPDAARVALVFMGVVQQAVPPR